MLPSTVLPLVLHIPHAGTQLPAALPHVFCAINAVFAERHVGDERVPAMMIELNRRLYLTQPNPALEPVRNDHFWRMKALIGELLLTLCRQLANRLAERPFAA